MKRVLSTRQTAMLALTLALLLLVGLAVVRATFGGPDAAVFQACVDQHGNIRLLGEGILGKFSTECKDNEVPYAFAPSHRVDQLEQV